MTYEKTSRKKKAHQNLENCRYFRVLMAYATLDSTQKNCWGRFTDGEDDRNSYLYRRNQQCSSSFVCYQGQTTSWWLYMTSGSESRNSSVAAYAVLSADRDIWAAAIYPACCQHCLTFQQSLRLCSCYTDAGVESYNKQPRVQRCSWRLHSYQNHLWHGRRPWKYG